MTAAVICLDPPRYSLTMQGHATGSDAACAACSGLAWGLAGWLENRQHEHCPGFYRAEIKGGLASIDVEGDSYTEECFRLVAIALLQIQQQYPDYVRVQVVENPGVDAS